MAQRPSPQVEELVTDYVMRDLNPSWLAAHTKVAAAAVTGGFLSLLVCGQFGVGITPFATAFSDQVHSRMGSMTCAITCGTFFALFPVAVLRFVFCRPLQFKAIIRRRWPTLVLWFGGLGGIMASMGHHGNHLPEFLAWVSAAILATNVLARAMDWLAPAWTNQRLLRIPTS